MYHFYKKITMSKKLIYILSILLLSGCWDSDKIKDTNQDLIPEKTSSIDQNQDTSKENNISDSSITKSQSKKKISLKNRGFEIETDDITLGNHDADIVVIEYFSPTCPHCVHYNQDIFPQIMNKYIKTGQILYVMREFIGNRQDLDATILARCSDDQEIYHKFMGIILERQDNWAYDKNYRRILTNIGAMGGISATQYSNCLDDKKLMNMLFSNTKFIANKHDFIGTPSFFINQKSFNKPYTIENLSKAIDQAIIENKQQKNKSDMIQSTKIITDTVQLR